MIKKFFIVIFIAAASFTVNAQSAFQNGDIALNAGIGLGWGYSGGYTGTGLSSLAPIPSFNASLEVGIIDLPNVGVISVGGFGSFRTTWDRGNSSVYGVYYDYDYSYRNAIVAARGVFHFGFFDTGGFDLYAGIHSGVRFSSYSYTIDYGGIITDYEDTDSQAYFVHDVFAGARWMTSDKFGFFAELGYGISYLKAGITLKF